ncbi:MAG TPA: response regulator [Myxococcales bacterium]
MAGLQASALLGSFLTEHEASIVKRAVRDLKWSLQAELPRTERARTIASFAGSLGSLLLERGDDAPRLWAEEIRHQGGAQLDARKDVGDLVRELHSLHRAVLEEWGRRAGTMSHEVAKLLSECIAEGSAAVVSDYVRRVRGEQVQFRESALIHMLLENLDEGLLLVEADGTLSFATRPAFQLLGGRVHSVLGRSLVDPAMEKMLAELRAQTLEGEPISPSDLPGAKTLQTAQPSGPMLMEVHVDGHAKVLELGALPIFEEGGEKARLRGAIITARDRTVEARRTQELKQAERELSELHTRLLHRSRAQAMGELASGMAHALNNQLNAMHLRLRLLRESPGPEQILELERSVEDIAKLVAWLQQFSAQRSAGPVEAVSLDSVVKDAIALVRPEARRAGEGAVRVSVKTEHPPKVRGNPSELREILVSLLLYVRDQLAAGGQIDLVAAEEQGHIVCRIAFRADVGMPARPEEWLTPPTAETTGPAALALAAMTARDMLSRWGGGLETRSLETGGAEFVLTFSPAHLEAEAAPQPPPTEAYHRHVLVIDDDEDNAAMLAEVLATEGHHTDTASTGKQALEKWREGPFDVALVDLLMPDVSGTELAVSLAKIRPDARLALVTGWELDEEQRRVAPVHAVFRKPVDLALLLQFLAPPEPEHRPPAPPSPAPPP